MTLCSYQQDYFQSHKQARGNLKVFFSKLLMGGGAQFFLFPSVPIGGKVKWGGGDLLKSSAEAKIYP